MAEHPLEGLGPGAVSGRLYDLLIEINERLIDLELDRMLFDIDEPYPSYLVARDEARQCIKDRYG